MASRDPGDRALIAGIARQEVARVPALYHGTVPQFAVGDPEADYIVREEKLEWDVSRARSRS
jgi:hypothetical protein